MDLNEYIEKTNQTAVYPAAGTGQPIALAYAALGLAGESGEVAEKIKKILRDTDGVVTKEAKAALQKELGDVAWYWARLHRELRLDPDETLDLNVEKLFSRKERGVLRGSGDDR